MKTIYPMSSLLKAIFMLLLLVAAYQTYLSKKPKGSQEGCIIDCKGHPAVSKINGQLCLTLEQGKEKCFYADNIILIKSYNGKSVVYDYDGHGQYVKENLKEIGLKLSGVSSHFYHVNRQDLVNMIYAKKIDKCQNTLYLCGEFDCAIPRRKYQDVENLMYQYCTNMCQ